MLNCFWDALISLSLFWVQRAGLLDVQDKLLDVQDNLLNELHQVKKV